MMKIHILQHVAFEGPAYIEEWAKEASATLSYTLLYEGDIQFPAVGDIDVVVIMGGPMSVNDEHLYGWISREKAFISACIGERKKIIGICLGAQMIASCLGARVYPASEKEIGWHAVRRNAALSENWLTRIFNASPQVFHWHGEQFDLPGSAEDLLTTDANNHQAYLIDDYILGFQFHLEATEESIRAMLAHGSDELVARPFVQSAAQILGSLHHVPVINQLMKSVLDYFLGRTAEDQG